MEVRRTSEERKRFIKLFFKKNKFIIKVEAFNVFYRNTTELIKKEIKELLYIYYIYTNQLNNNFFKILKSNPDIKKYIINRIFLLLKI